MRYLKHTLLVGMISILPIASLPICAQEPARVGEEQLSISATFTKVKPDSEDFYCSIEIADIDSGKIISKPKVRIRKGNQATVIAGDQQDPYKLEIEINNTGTTASVKFSNSKNGKTTRIQKITISIQ